MALNNLAIYYELEILNTCYNPFWGGYINLVDISYTPGPGLSDFVLKVFLSIYDANIDERVSFRELILFYYFSGEFEW
jgi:hypothetical protein